MHRKMHRDVVKVVLDQISEDIAPHHVVVMKILAEAIGTSHPSELGETVGIAKSQMTHSIDRLIELGMVRRQHDTKDRRRINIQLTQKGKTTLARAERLLKDRWRARLSSLQEGDLEKLADSLGNMAEILTKIE
jgi:DNA-binding MarR family transcriptional regulator